MYDPVAEFYSKPQLGSGIAIYQGNRRQTGGGIFQSIARFAVPILRTIKNKLLGIAPALGNKAMEVVKDTIEDVQSGKRTFVQALRENTRDQLRQHGLLPPAQEGSGINMRRGRKRKASTKKRKTPSKAKKIKYRDILGK